MVGQKCMLVYAAIVKCIIHQNTNCQAIYTILATGVNRNEYCLGPLMARL